jgi:hypothetical protein
VIGVWLLGGCSGSGSIQTPSDQGHDPVSVDSGDTSEADPVSTDEPSVHSIQVKPKESIALSFAHDGAERYRLDGAPKGMRILPDGTVVWTPTQDQNGTWRVTIEAYRGSERLLNDTLTVQVESGSLTYDGLFVDPTGSGSAADDGTPLHPYHDFETACAHRGSLQRIYLRGGLYRNPGWGQSTRTPARFPAIQKCVGTAQNPIVVRPWGNEYVTLATDALYGLKIKESAQHIVVEGLEIVGVADALTQEEVLKQWWNASDTIKTIGISVNGDHVTVRNNIIHHMPGSGISVAKAVAAHIEGNIVYACDWWTISGSSGIGITQAREAADSTGRTENVIENNLIFGVEQRIFSRVWNKGFATLTIDEGEAFLIQEGKDTGDSVANYRGQYRIANNLIAYNGKSGVINMAKNVTIEPNSYYQNGTLTRQGGFRINKSPNITLRNNAVAAPADTLILSVGGSDQPTASNNYVAGGKDRSLPDGFEQVSDGLFVDAAGGDFTTTDAVPDGVGVDPDLLKTLRAKLARYRIRIQPTGYRVDPAAMTRAIIDHRPAGSSVDTQHLHDADPYVIIENLPAGHPAGSRFKLYVPHYASD